MTLPILHAAVELGQDTTLTLWLGVLLGGGLVTGSLAYARLHARAEELARTVEAHEEAIEALKVRASTTDTAQAVMAQQVAALTVTVLEIRADVKTLLLQGSHRNAG